MGVKLKAVWWEGYCSHNAVWWENFRRGSTFRNPTERTIALAEWGAVWREDVKAWSRWLEFENERDATVFLLRWS